MYSFSELVENLPSVGQARVVSSGFGVWMVWSGQLSKALTQTLEDHGGVKMSASASQALWFFSTREAFKALARLQIWARINPLPLFFAVVPASILVGWKNDVSLSVSAELLKQEVHAPDSFEVLVHPRCHEALAGLAGLTLKPVGAVPGLAAAEWKRLEAESGFSYDSSLAWYFVIKPLGNPGERDYTLGWRGFFNNAEAVLRRMGLKYIYNESALILPLENLRLLRSWTKEMLTLMRGVKADSEAHYWPCVMVAVGKEGLNFNEDLPRKLNIEWNRLSPDYPHMSYRTAFLMGEEFTVNAVSYFNERQGLDNWCYVSLSQAGEDGTGAGSLQVDLPRRILVGTEAECFYCGLKNHRPSACPSRQIPLGRPKVFEKLASINVEDLSAISAEVDEALQKNPLQAIPPLLEANSRAGLLVQGMFENTLPFQLRMLAMVWRSRSKDWEDAFDSLGPEEGEFIWNALESLRKDDRASAEQLAAHAMARYPRSYQPRALNAFLLMEADDHQQAMFFFQEAERLSYTPVQRAVLCMFMGRLWEYQYEFGKAVALYKQAEGHARGWSDALYRQAVCLVKMGFTEHAIGIIQQLVERDPHMFNRIVIDPELERGRFSILSALWDIWRETRDEAGKARKIAEELAGKLDLWFSPEHEFLEVAAPRIDKLLALTRVENFVSYRRLIAGTKIFNQELQEKVAQEIKLFEKRVTQLIERLSFVQRDASWFPFPKLLRDFNHDFNFCADKLNWMRTQHMQIAENFRKAQGYLADVEERLTVLQGRLVTLRIIRDSTFFVLLLGRNFIWLELIGLALALVMVPAIIYGAQHYFESWALDLLTRQKWQLQKGLIVILSVVAMIAAAIKTAVSFERKKEELFSAEYEKELREQAGRKKTRGRRKPASASGGVGKGKATAAKGAAKAAPARSGGKSGRQAGASAGTARSKGGR
ncbi:hypothetical protein dsat_2588 [Alkalidesulfovibrio alkalitolerans DSM 16529]|jgi:tetratricopeptide (TPR) repeat protein|uniref:Tetratricopeptide repeat-containing protein n=1 Tax=Alkalidesulfovibrio alkalitolerans DSM 16529 TaxID=1121439 RepID=S7ULN7_9BACT|nr:hypothetical protein [Alkalidesulfovibrio alkalitolerans]EPR34769.1 hypothetical protein dsat_2588 [Alkalidesulfovibrio alkalitolerans DSM 16529]